MLILALLNSNLFLAFPVACFLIRYNPKLHTSMVDAQAYIRMSLEYTTMWLFAVRGVNMCPGDKSLPNGVALIVKKFWPY